MLVTRWAPEDFKLETTTVWDFPKRGDWAVHSGDYRGNWPPQLVRNLIERYTKPGDLVADAFVGGGTTLIEAWLLGRRSLGLDVSKLAIHTCRFKLDEMARLADGDDRVSLDDNCRPVVLEQDAMQLSDAIKAQAAEDCPVSLLCVHPPYLDSLSYTTGDARDLSRIGDPSEFIARLKLFAQEARKVVAPGGTCAVLIGDVRKKGQVSPLGFETLSAFTEAGFAVDEVVIKRQNRDRSSEFYYGQNARRLMMAHEYLLILSKSLS